MNKDLEVLAQHRDAILLAEIGALLHDLGKLDSRFIIQMSADRPSSFKRYEHEKILKDLPQLKNLLSDKVFTDTLADLGNIVQGLAPPTRRSELSLDRIISKHHDDVKGSPIGYYKLIAASTCGVDGVDSGIDKGTVSSEAKQTRANTYIATTFGFEGKCIDATKNDLGPFQQKLVQILKSGLKKVINGTAFNMIRSNIIQAAKQAFVETLGDTRRAANDVTLWDHSYSVASLYKAALAKILLDGQWTEPKELQWRILRISLDGLSFLNSVHRVPDILGRQQALTDALDKVKELLEVEYPLGNEIYRDENGSAFVVPDVGHLLDRVNNEGKSLQQLIEEAFTKSDLKEEVELILSPEAFSDASRGAILLGELLKKPIPLLTTGPNVVQKWWDSIGEICTVCGLRPQGFGAEQIETYKHNLNFYSQKAKNRNICCICLKRREGRSETWAKRQLSDTTIWIDEAADINARVALIVGRFDLVHWLDGSYLNSFFTQSLQDWQNGLQGLYERFKSPNKAQWENEVKRIATSSNPYSELLEKLKIALSESIANAVGDETKFWLHSIAPEAYDGKRDAKEFIIAICKRDLHKFIPLLPNGEPDLSKVSAEQLALLLLRKHPSFARLRRIWDTTRKFWVDFVEGRDDQPSLIAKIVGQTGLRLKITASNIEKLKLGHYHTYELVLNGMRLRLSVVWAAHLNGFITVDNLCYVAKLLGAPEAEWTNPEKAALFVKSKLPDKIRIEEPPGYGIKAEKIGTLEGVRAEIKKDDQGQLQTYVPAIPILTEPRTFMVLVPAKKALEVVAEIKKKYEIEMGKVRNRLSLFVGIVYFHRRIPLRAALEAGRRMLRMQNKEGIWEVKESRSANDEEKARYEGKLGSHAQYLGLQDQEGREISWIVPYSLGDDSEDYYYPYFFVEELAPRTSSDELKHLFRAPRPGQKEMTDLVHVKELQKGDKVYITPSRFDFEFLETSGRRFEVSYNDQGLRRNPARRTRPYLLEEIETLQHIWWLLSGKGKEHPKTEWKGLTTTQIEALVSIIEAKREEWNQPTGKASYHTTFEHLVKDVLRRADWPDGWAKMAKEDQSLLEEAAKNGILADVVELYMTVMKEKPKKEE